MPNSKFVVSSKIANTYRVNAVKGIFDVDIKESRHDFDVNIPIEDMKWNVGLIVGASGTGKTTIAKTLFKDYQFFTGYEWTHDCLLDDFPEGLTPTEITEALSKCGFSSPPEWLKPFHVLSNGQKMRVELARLILQADKPVIYDEFTSVVDRKVACVGSHAIQRYVRKTDKQFIALSCHYDIEEWLEPDWVYDVNTHEFSRRTLRRPEIKIDIRKAKHQEWKLFAKYHYLSANHNSAAHCYIAEIDGEPVAWCSVLHFAHPHVKNMKKIHRLVVLPDYQGISLGIYFLEYLGEKYAAEGYRLSIVSSIPAVVKGLRPKNGWYMTRKPSRLAKSKTGILKETTSENRLTASFEYKKKSDR